MTVYWCEEVFVVHIFHAFYNCMAVTKYILNIQNIWIIFESNHFKVNHSAYTPIFIDMYFKPLDFSLCSGQVDRAAVRI